MSAEVVARRGRRAGRRPEVLVTAGVVALALALLAAAFRLEGSTALAAPLVCALALTLPGDLLRRAVRPGWPLGGAETIAVNLVGSCGLLVVLGGLLAAVGELSRGPVLVAGSATLIALAWLATRRGGTASGWLTTLRGCAVLVALGSASLCLFHIEPLIGDRVFLGQLRTSTEVLESGRIPRTSWTYGARTPFPINYVFVNLIFSVIALVGGFQSWPAWKLLAGALRLLQLGLFATAWYLVGRELLRRFRANYVTLVGAAALPLVLLSNLGLRNKFREPLVEGFAIVLLGIGVWAVLRSTDEATEGRGYYAALSVLAVALLVGIHFPVFVEAVILVGAWLLVAPVFRSAPSPRRRSRRAGPALRWMGTLTRRAAPYGAGVIAALVYLQLLAGTTFLSPATGEIPPKLAFRAYLLYIGNPLSRATVDDFVQRRLSAQFLLTQDPYSAFMLAVGLVAAVGLLIAALRNREAQRSVGWWAAAAVFTACYAAVGFYYGRTDVTPWNAVTRNAFYIWVPISLAIIFGVRGAAALVESDGGERRARPRWRSVTVGLLATGLLVSLVWPFVDDLGSTVQENGWIQPPQISTDGKKALRWVSHHTPRDSVLLTSEETFGSDLIANRRSVTEGFATLENKAVVAKAVDTLSQATEFFLPSHAPKILLDKNVDYVVTVGNGVYSPGEFGGYPLLTNYARMLHPLLPTLSLAALPYLHPVRRFGRVTIYRVDHDLIPKVTVTRLRPGEPLPTCADDVCLVYAKLKQGSCPADQLSAEPRVCIVRLTGPSTPSR